MVTDLTSRRRLISLTTGLFIGAAAFFSGLIMLSNARGVRDLNFYVNLFKFSVGLFCIGFSLWWFYGSIAAELGYGNGLTPPPHAPRKIAVIYFVGGFAVLLASLRIFTTSDVYTSLGIVWSYTVIFGLAVGFGVYVYMDADAAEDMTTKTESDAEQQSDDEP